MPYDAHYRFAVHLQVNGEDRVVGEGATLNDLIADLELGGRRIAVEINREIVARDSFGECALHEGDVVEIVHFIGGG